MTCVDRCPNNGYHHQLYKKCYSVCPTGYYGNILNYTCVDQCPDGMFINKTSMLCEYCDFDCDSCSVYSFNCLNCKYDWLSATPHCSKPYCNNLIFYNI